MAKEQIKATSFPNYEQDLVVWFDDTVTKLKMRQFSNIDIDHLIEEIAGLAGRDRRELKNRMEVLFNHLLKRVYVNSPDDFRGWELTIREQRRQLQTLLEQSPSLRNDWAEAFSRAWTNALTDAQEDYPQSAFPTEWTYSSDIDALLSEKFWLQ